MSVALVYPNVAGSILQFNDHAAGARVVDEKGHWVEVHYDRATQQWTLKTDSTATSYRIKEVK